MENLKLVILLLIYSIRGSCTQSFPCHTASGDNCTSSICPNTVVTYTCTITSGTPAGLTDWTLSTGTCTNNTFPDKIRLSQLTSQQCSASGSGVPSMCGTYRASSIQSSDPTYCLSSTLSVNIAAAMNGSTVTCSNTNLFNTSITTVVSMATINVVGPPGSPNVVAKTIGPNMVLVILNPSSSGGLPTSYNVNISNSSYVYSNSTPAFLNGSAMVTFTGLTNSTTYTISAVAINCANSSNPTTIYISWAAPPPSPSTSSASNPSTTSPAPKPTPTPDPIIGAIVGGVVGGVAVVIVVIIVVVLLICLCKTSTENKTKEHQDVQVQLVPPQPMPPPRDPIATRQASKVPAEESLYNASTQDQRVPEESLYDAGVSPTGNAPIVPFYDVGVGPTGNVPTGRGGNAQEAVYSQPDTSKKNTDKMMYAAVQVAPAARNPPSERAGRRMPPPPNTSQQQDVFYSTVKT